MAIHIKKSKVGSLHKHLGVKKGDKIPASKLKDKPGDSKAVKKKKVFARNAKKWKHPEGGTVRPTKTSMVVSNNVWTPQTRQSIYPLLAKAGMVGHGADSLTLDQWNKLIPEDTMKYMNRDKGFDYTVGNTANPGGVKYWSMDLVPNMQSYVPNSNSTNYLTERSNTKYPGGGQVMSGIGGVLGAIPTPYTQIAGAVLNFGGMLLSGNEQKKAEEKAALQDYQTSAQNAARLSNSKTRNPFTTTFAYGGLAPNGTPIEVEDEEVMRNPNDGSMVEFDGATHAQGGIDVEAEPGSQIFGNLKIKSGTYKGMEYKEAAQVIKDKIARLQKKLDK